MAEVYLGTHQAIGGFRKLVVLKRLLGWQRDDGQAVVSLLDEARIAATINHPNIVTTLDIGLDRGSPYIVLEYLSGEDLRYVLQHMHERDAIIPVGIACRIGAAIASALAQAHDLTLPDGSRHCIVHRDVTPSNIIVCYTGVTKLVDFGVARVVDDANKTKSGMVKGKFSYLAPEQLKGEPLDGRTDVFQLGIVLWEMVTTKRLFEGRSDHERINAILYRRVRPPGELNPAVPAALERTILRALERDPAARYQSAAELEAELLLAVGAVGGSGGDHSVGKWLQQAFAERYSWRLDLERRAVAEAAATAGMIGSDDDDDDDEVAIDPTADPLWSHRRLQTGPTVSARDVARSMTAKSLRGVRPHVARSAAPARRRGLYAGVAIAVLAAALWWWRGSSRVAAHVAHAAGAASGQIHDYDVDIRVSPLAASIAIDGVVVANGRYRASLPDDGVTHAVTVTAANHATVLRRFHSSMTLEVVLEPLAPEPPPQQTGQTSDHPADSPPSGLHVAEPAHAAEPAHPAGPARSTTQPARSTHDGRELRKRALVGASTATASAGTASAATAAPAPDAATTDASGNGGSAAAAAPPSPKPPSPKPPKPPQPPKPADDPFASSSDNIDPFKPGN